MRAWAFVALALIGVGVGVSFLVASSVAQRDAHDSRQALRSGASAATAQIELAIVHEVDLELAANAFVVGNPRSTEAQFVRWAAAIRARERYPELGGLSFQAYVPAKDLVSFERRYTLHLPTPTKTAPGPRSIIPLGPRPFYCLTKVAVTGHDGFGLPPTIDTCAVDPAILGTIGSGASSSGSVSFIPGDAIWAIANPVYSGGGVPATPAERRQMFLGWTAMAILPDVLLSSAQRGHPGLTLTLKGGVGATSARFAIANPPRGDTTVRANLHDGWTLYVAGRVSRGGVFDNVPASRVLVGGSIFSVLLAAVLFLLATGRQRALRLVAQKTRELAAEVKLTASARDAAVEASVAKSAFVATVSHELRTPLAGVIGTADLLLDTPLDAVQEEYAETLRSSAEALLLVINDILDYSKVEAGKLELYLTDFSLRELIGECCSRVLPTARKKAITLENLTDTSVPAWVHGDSGRIGQVLTNLLANAVKFTEQGGVTIRATATVSGAMAAIRFEVTDTGIGIDAATLSRLFTPFTQADASTARRFGGTGLGLTICAELAELMGGRLGVESVPDTGSTFWFEIALPVAEDGGAMTIAVHERFAALGERDEDGNLTEAAPIILVAEDNPVNQMLAARMLDRCGFRSDVVSGGEEALSAVTVSNYAAILMDCQMPGMDGYDATRAIRRHENGSGHIPIIAVTAHSLAGDRAKCLAAGMDEYVSKPLRASELRAAIERAMSTAAQHLATT